MKRRRYRSNNLPQITALSALGNESSVHGSEITRFYYFSFEQKVVRCQSLTQGRLYIIYSAIINPLLKAVTYDHYRGSRETVIRPVQRNSLWRIIPVMSPGYDSVAKQKSSILTAHIYQDQRCKGQDEFLGESAAGGLRYLWETNDFRREQLPPDANIIRYNFCECRRKFHVEIEIDVIEMPIKLEAGK